MFFNTGEISFEESVLLHIVSGDCAIEALRGSEIEGGFLSLMDVLHDGPVPEVLRLEEYLIFELSSLQNVIGIFYKMLRTLFGKGTLFSIIVSISTKWYFGTALNCLSNFIYCSC